mmetsp:Transcript_17690/g.19380  ORF Transcript_17690/g.19380 Transcript_17690/m.19380 type:complete len:94 (+) Transcript_17690:152-433(+)
MHLSTQQEVDVEDAERSKHEQHMVGSKVEYKERNGNNYRDTRAQQKEGTYGSKTTKVEAKKGNTTNTNRTEMKKKKIDSKIPKNDKKMIVSNK